MNKIYDIITKEDTFDILTKYFKKFKSDDLNYYLNQYNNDIINFFNDNILDIEYYEIFELLNDHFKIAINKLNLYLKEDIFKDYKIKISFVTDLIYWKDMFVIEDIIYINYIFIENIFNSINKRSYKSVHDIYMINDKIYDLSLLKLFSTCLIYIYQFNTKNLLFKKVELNNNYNYYFENKYNIKNINNKKILLNPNLSFLDDKIIIYIINKKLYCCLNIIITSKINYSPYYEETIFELIYKDGNYYLEDNNIDIKLYSEPFIDVSNKIINNLYLY